VKRRLLTLAAAASLLLCAATVALWVRSHFVGDGFRRWNRWSDATAAYRGVKTFALGRGSLQLVCSVEIRPRRLDPTEPEQVTFSHSAFLHERPPARFDLSGTAWSFLGFGGYAKSIPWGSSIRFENSMMTIPLWAPTVFFAIPPGVWFIVRLKLRRANRESHCRTCGYDLRATPERCPECGASYKPTTARA
jgi:hypothetical protein